MLIDTFPEFLCYWHTAQSLPLDEQVDGWAVQYLAAWPELLEKQVQDYREQGLDWREVARERVFPYLSERLPAMQIAHDQLMKLVPEVWQRVRQVLGMEQEATFVIYVGIGCGAGWATTFNGGAAVLFGLENIAECGWTRSEDLEGLAAHELGHVAHQAWRLAARLEPGGEGPLWQLYEEGFAQCCEQRVLRAGSWHMNTPTGNEETAVPDSWLAWCENHRDWLAREFLRRMAAGEPVQDFFGSWFNIDGYPQTGYYLGQQVIQDMHKTLALEEIARLPDPETYVWQALKDIAATPA